MLLVLGCFISFASYAGPESGGGGNVCAVANKLRALDIADVSSSKYESAINKMVKPIRFSRQTRTSEYVTVNAATAFEQFGYIDIDAGYLLDGGYGFLLGELRREVPGTSASAALAEAAQDLRVFAVPTLPGHGAIDADFSETKSCSSMNTTAAVLYNWNLGIVLDAKIWNRLDSFNQVTLLVHEALRNIQIRFGSKFSNLELQKLTSAFVTGDFKRFAKRLESVTRLPVRPNRYIKELCSAQTLESIDRISVRAGLKKTCAKPTSKALYQLIKEIRMPRFAERDPRFDNSGYLGFMNMIGKAYVTSLGISVTKLDMESQHFGTQFQSAAEFISSWDGYDVLQMDLYRDDRIQFNHTLRSAYEFARH
jgi:hypothetical protein